MPDLTPRGRLLAAFVDNLRPTSHDTAGVLPARFDLSLTADELTSIGAALLVAYDAAGHPGAVPPAPVLAPAPPPPPKVDTPPAATLEEQMATDEAAAVAGADAQAKAAHGGA